MIRAIVSFPNAGIDLLIQLLRQNPDLEISNSRICELLLTISAYTDAINITKRLLHNEVEKFEIHTHLAWANKEVIKLVKDAQDCSPKIIALVRSVDECLYLGRNDIDPIEPKVKFAFQTLLLAQESYPDAFCFVEYENLVKNPKAEIKKIASFLELNEFDYEYAEVSGNASKLMVPDDMGSYNKLKQPRFWIGETHEMMPKQPLDLQLEAARRGDFQKAWEISEFLAQTEPENNRAAYNRGTYVLMQGRLQEGMQLLARGRLEQVFGNSKPNVPTPIWQGEPNQIVLLYLEGGLGDQIHQMRFVQDITARKCRVIVACAPELIALFATIPNVHAVVVHGAAPGIFHTAWVPGMSAPIPLGIEYKDVWGRAYIPRPQVTKDKFRIGLRWQGNPNFEHDHSKYFPPELLFNAVKGFDVEFVSLQRDEGAQHRPDWIAESKLDSWQDTQLAVAGCDLVISSCTSVAHLSAAMGIPTWVAIPILPYYLWALPGSSVPWYDAVRLFRQTKYDSWADVFESIRTALGGYLNGVHHGRIKSVG